MTIGNHKTIEGYLAVMNRKQAILFSAFVSIILNLDRLILGKFSLIRLHDTFDSCLPLAMACARNILQYGLVTQLPQVLCGVSSLTLSVCYSYVLTGLFLPPYFNYIFHCLFIYFVAFLGMFLLLSDELRLPKESSLIAALFYVSVPAFLPWDLTIPGIPMLIYCLERVFDNKYALRYRMLCYGYVIIYFFSSHFVMISFALVPFYLSYFLLFSKIKRNVSNISLLFLIWIIYLLIHLPFLSEMAFHATDSHRNLWSGAGAVTWNSAFQSFLSKVFIINIENWYIAAPSLLGIWLLGYYLFCNKPGKLHKLFYFAAGWILFIEIFSFFAYESPLWEALKARLGFLRSIQFDRFYLELSIFFAFVVGVASEYFIKTWEAIRPRHLLIPMACVCAFVLACFLLNRQQFRWAEFIIQMLILLLFFILLILGKTGKLRLSAFSMLFLTFFIFAVLNTAKSRLRYGIMNWHHFFDSVQVQKIKEAEKNNLSAFRVARIGSPMFAQLLYNGFNCVDGYVTLYPQSYKELWVKVIEPELNASPIYRDYFLGWGGRVYLFDSINTDPKVIDKLAFNPNLLKLLGAKYIFSDKEIINAEHFGLITVLKKDPGYLKSSEFKKYFMSSQHYVYKNEEFAPPVFLTGSLRVFPGKEELLAALGSTGYRSLRENTLAAEGDLNNAVIKDLNISGAAITDYSISPDRITVKLHNRSPVILNLTRNYNANWLCEIDGRKAYVFRIYNSFMGVLVPSGSREVKFFYQNIIFNYSLWISIIWFLVCTIAVFVHKPEKR